MSRPDHPLDHLLRAAAAAERQAARDGKSHPAEPPFGMETRVLAAWRERGTALQDSALARLPVGLFLRAAACAWAVVLVAAFLNVSQAGDLRRTESDPYGELALVDSVIQGSLEP